MLDNNIDKKRAEGRPLLEGGEAFKLGCQRGVNSGYGPEVGFVPGVGLKIGGQKTIHIFFRAKISPVPTPPF